MVIINRPGDSRDDDWVIPFGNEVEVRRVRGEDWNSFNTLVMDNPDIEDGERKEIIETHCVGADVWTPEGCYKYLEAWLSQPCHLEFDHRPLRLDSPT